jgi:hypothetical protein
MSEICWLLTVDWCKKGKRGIFTDRQGKGYWKDDGPHTHEEMYEILGPFFLILNPQSLPFTEEDMAQDREWHPLAEYSGQYGYATTL